MRFTHREREEQSAHAGVTLMPAAEPARCVFERPRWGVPRWWLGVVHETLAGPIERWAVRVQRLSSPVMATKGSWGVRSSMRWE